MIVFQIRIAPSSPYFLLKALKFVIQIVSSYMVTSPKRFAKKNQSPTHFWLGRNDTLQRLNVICFFTILIIGHRVRPDNGFFGDVHTVGRSVDRQRPMQCYGPDANYFESNRFCVILAVNDVCLNSEEPKWSRINRAISLQEYC